jgi:hypothetical protein
MSGDALARKAEQPVPTGSEGKPKSPPLVRLRRSIAAKSTLPEALVDVPIEGETSTKTKPEAKTKTELSPEPGSTARERTQPAAVSDDALATLRLLLRVEADFRKVAKENELEFLAVNEIRKITRGRQALFVRKRGTRMRTAQVSSVATFDKNSPLIRWLEKVVHRALRQTGSAKPQLFRLSEHAYSRELEGQNYPFGFALWLPACYLGSKPFGGFLVLREVPWTEADLTVGERLAETFGHSATALKAGRVRPSSGLFHRALIAVSLLAVAAAMAIPVPMSALAPAEAIPAAPQVVAAPVDGVVAEIVVEPNAEVLEGDVLVRFNDTVQRNRLKVAEREVDVARARFRQLVQAALFDEKAKRELAIAQAELKLKEAERDFADESLKLTVLRAPRAGIAIFSDKKDWLSKPVSIGQRILEVADPTLTELRIDLAVSDSIVLNQGAAVRVFFDSEPLKARHAKVTIAPHGARVVEGNALAYRMVAAFDDDGIPPRPGLRGTAQVFGSSTPMGFYIFRKPISWVRQKIGL